MLVDSSPNLLRQIKIIVSVSQGLSTKFDQLVFMNEWEHIGKYFIQALISIETVKLASSQHGNS